MFSIKKILFFLVLVQFFINCLAISEKCENERLKSEKLLKVLLRIDREDLQPLATQEQFDLYCENAVNGLKSIKDFGKCVTGLPKQIMAIIQRNVARTVKHYCRVKINESRKYLACLAEPTLKKSLKSCIYKFAESSNYAIEKAEDSEMIPSMCCGFSRMNKCLSDTFSSTNACKDSNINLSKLSKTFIKQLFSGALDALCGNYNYNFCIVNKEILMNKIDKYGHQNPVTSKNFSVIKNLISAAERLTS